MRKGYEAAMYPTKSKMFVTFSSVRRILKREGGRNIRKFEKSKVRNEHCFTSV